MGVATTGTVRANRMGNAPLWDMVKINKEKHGSSDVVTDVISNMTAVRGKDDNKVMNAIFTFTANSTGQKLLSSCKTESEYWTTKHHKPI